MIHPMRKKFVSNLLANAVLTTLYGFDLEYSRPIWNTIEKTENVVKIYFTHAKEMYIDGQYLADTFDFDEKWRVSLL